MPNQTDPAQTGPETPGANDLVAVAIDQGVAILRMQAPPVNALGSGLRLALEAAWQACERNPQVTAIVLSASGKQFSAGADIAEFAKGMARPELPELLAMIEDSRLPVVAAITGGALGGGLELALACDYRYAVAKARLGLPEVSLGLIPGAGGTQRLPRLIGLEPAVTLICGGKPVSADEALKLGLVDQLFADAGQAQAAAITFARTLGGSGPRRTAKNAACVSVPADADYAQNLKAAVLRQAQGRLAPLRALESVLNAVHMPLAEGLARERAIFIECNASDQAKALQHVFAAERQVAHVRGIGKDVQPRPVSQVAVIGAGTMGSGIAIACLQAGLAVTLVDVNAASLERGSQNIRKIVDGFVAKGRISPAAAEAALAQLTLSGALADVAPADLIIEAVFENMAVKQQVFAELDRHARPGAVLATNTSTLDVNAIAHATSRPQDVIGLHFFSPAHVMRLLEIVRGAETAPEVVRTAIDLSRRIGKVGVVVGVCYGFVGNRMLEPYAREAHRLLLEGASPQAIDAALTKFGMAMGVLSMCDMAGNDVGALMRKEHQSAIAQDPSYCRMGDVLFDRGELGQKTGKGFYAYTGRDKAVREDLEGLIVAEATALGITRRAIGDDEIIERCLYPLVNEGFRILEEAIAQRPGDIDTIWCNGYGFPAHLGGPMHWAQTQGLGRILDGLQHWRTQLGAYGEMWFAPAELLVRLAHSGGSVADAFALD